MINFKTITNYNQNKTQQLRMPVLTIPSERYVEFPPEQPTLVKDTNIWYVCKKHRLLWEEIHQYL
jgi:hypothetical protein